MKTREDLTRELRLMGCERRYKPYLDGESRTTQLKVRRPAQIVDGQLRGTAINVCGPTTFRVWSPQVKKAKAYSIRYGLLLRLLTSECELYVPAHLADQILPKFGAMTKRNISAAHRARLCANGIKLARSRAKFLDLPAAET